MPNGSTYDIHIRALLEGQGFVISDAQVKQLSQSLIRLKTDADKVKSTFAGSFLGNLGSNIASRAQAELEQQVVAAVNLADKLGDLSAKAGVTASALQTIGNAASLAGGSIDGAAQAMAFLNRTNAAARGGDTDIAETYARLGVSIGDLQKLSPDQLFLRMADAVNKTSDRARTYADVLKVAGRDAGNLFATLEQGSEKIIKSGQSMGVWTDNTSAALADAKDELAKFNNQVTIATGKTLAFARALQEQRGTDWFSWAKGTFSPVDFALQVMEAGKAMKSAGGAARDAKPPVGDLGDAMSDTGDKAKEAAEKIAEFFGKRAFDAMPAEKQISNLQEQLGNLRKEAEDAMNGIKFKDADHLHRIARDQSPQMREKLIPIARKMAEAEDRLTETTQKQTKAAADNKAKTEELNARRKEGIENAQREIAIETARAAGQADRVAKLERERDIESEKSRLRSAGVDDEAKVGQLAAKLVDARNAAKEAADHAERDARARKDAADQIDRAKNALNSFDPSVGDEAGATGSRGARARNAARARNEAEARRVGRENGLEGEGLDTFVRNAKNSYNQKLRDKQGRGGTAIPGPEPIMIDNQPAVPKPNFGAPPGGGGGGQGAQQLNGAGQSLESSSANMDKASADLANAASAVAKITTTAANSISNLASRVRTLESSMSALASKLGH